MDTQMLDMGVRLMLVGMGAVFLLLAALVGAITLMSRLVMRFQPAVSAEDGVPEEIAAITAAIAHHRRSDCNETR